MKRAAILAALLAACGPPPPAGDDAGSCPVVTPTCPATAPSYAAAVQPILAKDCLPCHTPGRQPYAGFDLSSWSAVNGLQQIVKDQLFQCLMPNVRAGATFALDGGIPVMSEADRETVMDWCQCGAPNN